MSGRKANTPTLATDNQNARNTSRMAIAEIADELAAAYSSEEVEQYLDDCEMFETNLHARQLEEDALQAAAREFSESRQLFVGQTPMGLEQQFAPAATADQ